MSVGSIGNKSLHDEKIPDGDEDRLELDVHFDLFLVTRLVV